MTAVAEIMSKKVQTTGEKVSLLDALKKMKKLKIGSLVVVDGSEAVGIITDADILFKAVAEEKDLKKTVVEKIMSKPLITVLPSTPIEQAAGLMTTKRIKKLPVVDENGRLVGIVTVTDLIRNSSAFSGILIQMGVAAGAERMGA